jgi:hypothetical protein
MYDGAVSLPRQVDGISLSGIRGLLKEPRPCHCEECGEVMRGVEHDEAISIYAL